MGSDHQDIPNSEYDRAQDLIADFGESPHYSINSALGNRDLNECIICSLDADSSLLRTIVLMSVLKNNSTSTVEAYSSEHDVDAHFSMTGTSADDLEAGVAQ